jgi:GNAT superfamily N-acetyltransferase
MNETDLRIRPLAATDSLEAVTELLHRAYAPLGKMGLAFTAVDQSAETTRQRAAKGVCFVAESNGEPVGTITVRRPPADFQCDWYARADVASAIQLAVEPARQGQGVGSALLRQAEAWAVEKGFAELALDTAAAATHLVAYYRKRDFRTICTLTWPHKNYASVILSKPLGRKS